MVNWRLSHLFLLVTELLESNTQAEETQSKVYIQTEKKFPDKYVLLRVLFNYYSSV